MKIKLTVMHANEVIEALKKAGGIDLNPAVRKSVTDMFNRAAKAGAAGGGTPVDSGELRVSRSVEFGELEGEFGYTKEYAPHVEYGHRVVIGGEEVGYVEGQHFLQQNMEAQEPIFLQDVNGIIEEAIE